MFPRNPSFVSKGCFMPFTDPGNKNEKAYMSLVCKWHKSVINII